MAFRKKKKKNKKQTTSKPEILDGILCYLMVLLKCLTVMKRPKKTPYSHK